MFGSTGGGDTSIQQDRVTQGSFITIINHLLRSHDISNNKKPTKQEKLSIRRKYYGVTVFVLPLQAQHQ